MSNGRILVVEDNRDNITLISDMLVSMNYEAILAYDGQRGVELTTSEKPDLILMDLSLPVMDGWAATRTIKANPELKHIPIIALTAHAMLGDRERALEAGCDDYATKPINMPELSLKISQFMRARKVS
ncbi:MAG: response regulator [Anaerolineae bacterium]|nr:response regulator [Anaerolineae bacterium]